MAAGVVAIGNLLRRARLRAGLTQEELAAESDVAIRTIGDLERGRIQHPHRRTMELLAGALPLDAADLQAVTGRLPRPPMDLDEPTTSGGPTRWTLPVGPAVFVGRTDDLSTLSDRLDAAPVLIVGAPGTGKTALALQFGAENLPDGQVLLTCGGSGSDPVEVHDLLGFVLRAMRVDAADLPHWREERETLYRSISRDRTMLLVLDDVANEAQVRPFLVRGGVRLVVTSRRLLPGIGAGVERLVLDRLTVPESVALVTTLIGRDRAAAESEGVLELIGLCDRHPLALTAVGSRLATRPGWPVADLVQRLQDEPGRLSRLDLADLSVRARLAGAYSGLEPPARRLFSRLALLGAEAVSSRQVANALLDGDQVRAEALLDEITDAGMLAATSSSRIYRIPLLHRLFAAEMLDGPVVTGRLLHAVT